MKQRVILSSFSKMLTGILLLLLLAVILYGCKNDMPLALVYIILVLVVGLVIGGLIFMPLSVSVTDKSLTVNRLFTNIQIPLDDIASIKLCQPTMAEIRLLGSSGFMGYYGWFTEPSIGKYFASYGRASDCFLVELKSGKKYLLGCEKPEEIVKYTEARLTEK